MRRSANAIASEVCLKNARRTGGVGPGINLVPLINGEEDETCKRCWIKCNNVF